MLAQARALLAALVVLAVSAGGGVYAAGGDDLARGAMILGRIENHYASLAGLQADFLQVWRPGRFSGAVEEKGTLWVRRPGLARWEYLEPEHKIALVTPERETWFYVPAEGQALHGRLGEELPPHLAILTGSAGLLEAYRLVEAKIGEEGAGRAGLAVLALEPRGEAAAERIVMTVETDPPRLSSLVVAGTSGEQTEYVLLDVDEEVEPPLSLFRFEPPEGVEVVEQEAPEAMRLQPDQPER